MDGVTTIVKVAHLRLCDSRKIGDDALRSPRIVRLAGPTMVERERERLRKADARRW